MRSSLRSSGFNRTAQRKTHAEHASQLDDRFIPGERSYFVSIGGDGTYTYLSHVRDDDGSIINALMVEDGHRLATRDSERIASDVIADIEKSLGDVVPDYEGLRDQIYAALNRESRRPHRPATAASGGCVVMARNAGWRFRLGR
jgi:hypothetical protein